MTGNGAIVPGSKTADRGDTQTGGRVTFEFAITCTKGLGTLTGQLRITTTTPGKKAYTTHLTPADVTRQWISGTTAHIAGHVAIGGSGSFPFTVDATDGASNGHTDHIRITVFTAKPKLTATATGVPTPTVRWQQSTNAGRTWTYLTSEQTTTLSLTPNRRQPANRYRAVFTNTTGSTTSTAATLTVRG